MSDDLMRLLHPGNMSEADYYALACKAVSRCAAQQAEIARLRASIGLAIDRCTVGQTTAALTVLGAALEGSDEAR